MNMKVKEIVSEHEHVKAAYRRLFQTRDGEIVLADLAKQFYDCKIKPDELERQVGKRDVVHYLKNQLKE